MGVISKKGISVMKNVWEKLGELVRHNKGQVVAVVLVCLMMGWVFGCDSTVTSIRNPDVKITKAELELEHEQEVKKVASGLDREVITLQAQIDTLIENAEMSREDIEMMYAKKSEQLRKQDEFKQMIVEVGMVVAQGGTVNPVGIALTALGILGIGAVVDNQKKDGLLKKVGSEGEDKKAVT